MVITMIPGIGILKCCLNENDSSDFITREVASKRGTDAAEEKRHSDEVKKDHSARYLMLSCMADNIIYEFKKFESSKAMLDSLQKLFWFISLARLYVI